MPSRTGESCGRGERASVSEGLATGGDDGLARVVDGDVAETVVAAEDELVAVVAADDDEVVPTISTDAVQTVAEDSDGADVLTAH